MLMFMLQILLLPRMHREATFIDENKVKCIYECTDLLLLWFQISATSETAYSSLRKNQYGMEQTAFNIVPYHPNLVQAFRKNRD